MLLILVIIIALLGAYLGLLTTLPLAHLFGAAIAVIFFLKTTGKQIQLPSQLIIIIQLILGLSIGITVDLSTLLVAFSPSIILGLVLCIFCQIMINYLWLNKIENWNTFDSILGSMPGALGAIIAMIEERGAPAEKVIFSHSVRLLILISLAGIIAQDAPPVEIVATFQSQYSIDIILILSFMVGILLRKIAFPAPFILATISYLNIFHITDIVLPDEFMLFITTALGLIIGVRLTSTT